MDKVGVDSMVIIGWMLIGVDIFIFLTFFICLFLATRHIHFQLKKLHRVKRRIRALATAVSSNRHMTFMVSSHGQEATELRLWETKRVQESPANSTKVVPSGDTDNIQMKLLKELHEIEKKFGKESEEYSKHQNMILHSTLFGEHSS